MTPAEHSVPLWRRLRAEALKVSWWLRWELSGSRRDDWRDDAKCRGAVDLFYSRRSADIAAAQAVCLGCPVRRECLQEGFEVERTIPLFDVAWSGVLGGFTPDERARYFRGQAPRRDPRRTASVCGTDAGYMAHRRRGETACDDCKAAHSRKEVARVARRRAEHAEAGPLPVAASR